MGDVGLAMQRAQDKTEQMQARAGALDELLASGALQDATAPGGRDDVQAQLDALTAGHDVDGELAGLLIEPVPGDGLSHHLRDRGSWEQLQEYFVHRSIYHLKEADPHAWVIPRLQGQAKAALVAVEYTVAFSGFAPGFGYLTGLPEELHVPRRATPRTRVPAGAVGLAGPYAGAYPRPSPGGWQLVGRTDAVLFDVERDEPALLRPGARVRFREVG